MKWKISLILVVAIGLAAGGLMMARKPVPAQHSSMMKEVTAQQIFAQIQNLKAPVVLVNFWASWCEPCKQEFPELLRLREAMASKGLKVMFVTIDEPQDLAAAEAFLKQQNVTFETYAKGAQPLTFVSTIYPKWEGAVPTTLLFDPNLKLLDAWEGDASMAEFEQRVQKHLGGT